MSAAQRVSRKFHRLGPFLAAVPLLIVGTWSVFNALNAANNARLSHDEQAHLVCAKARIAAMRKTLQVSRPFDSTRVRMIYPMTNR